MSDWKALKIPQDYEVGKVRPIKKTTSSKPYSRPVIRNVWFSIDFSIDSFIFFV